MEVKSVVDTAKEIQRIGLIVNRLAELATDRGKDWRRGCEFNMIKVGMVMCSRNPEFSIELWLVSHPTGRFNSMGRDKAEQRRDLADNKYAREVVNKILDAFKVKAERSAESPEHLRIKLADNCTLSIYGYPTKVTYQCEKQCVAVLENGKKIPLNKIPLEA